jgi:nucleotide-binding universal stress UspA family protein
MKMKLKRILVPTDFSEFSQQALDDAAELAKPFKARLIVLHSLEPIYFATPADLYGPSANLSMLVEEQRRCAQEQLARLARALEKRRIPVETLLASGSPHTVILDTAKKRGADLIVMSTHGRGGLSHLMMGSVAEKVVRGASCPVLTVRAKKGGRRTATRSRRRRT